MNWQISSAIWKGGLATGVLLVIYVTVVTLVSGWDFAMDQFGQYWYFTVSLAMGFGVQMGLYSYLKSSMKQNVSPVVAATTGTTSTAAMISCCAHYLVNLLPILGTVGVITIISQYQIQLFWVGLAFNFAGIVYMANKVYEFRKSL